MQAELTNLDLGTYAGISVIVVALVGAIKKMFPAWTDKKEPLLALILALALGMGAKFLPGVGSFEKVHWLVHGLNLIFTALGAGLLHDKIVNPLLRGKDDQPKT